MDAFNTEALKLTVMGVTVTVSSGDDGVASQATLCNANSGSAASDWPVRSLYLLSLTLFASTSHRNLMRAVCV
jgi:hypothetical protein